MIRTKANLALFNFGASALTVRSSAHAMNTLIRPASVILTHLNEAATVGGKVCPASRTASIIKLFKGPVPHLSINGRAMAFDAKGKCVAGC